MILLFMIDKLESEHSFQLSGWPFTWKSGKSQISIFWWKSQGNSWKTVSQRKCKEKLNYFANVLENVEILHFISMFCQWKDKSYQCYILLFCWQIWVWVNILNQGKVRENETNIQLLNKWPLSSIIQMAFLFLHNHDTRSTLSWSHTHRVSE